MKTKILAVIIVLCLITTFITPAVGRAGGCRNGIFRGCKRRTYTTERPDNTEIFRRRALCALYDFYI